MRILILDDQQIRHDGFIMQLHGHHLFHAHTMSQAQAIVERQAAAGQPIEMACLDHDLGDFSSDEADFYYDSVGCKVYYTGAHFAYWLRNQDFCPKKILIHSWNRTGANQMKAQLESVAGISIEISPFKPPKL